MPNFILYVFLTITMRHLITWFDPNVAVSCQDRKRESVAPWRQEVDTYANICCLFHPPYFPTGVGFGIWHRNLTFIQVHMALHLFFFNNNCLLLEVSQPPLFSGNMEAFMFSVTFMQNMENSFNYRLIVLLLAGRSSS